LKQSVNANEQFFHLAVLTRFLILEIAQLEGKDTVVSEFNQFDDPSFILDQLRINSLDKHNL
jgi:hypothetical protein